MTNGDLRAQGAAVRAASKVLALSANDARCAVLRTAAAAVRDHQSEILTTNAQDLARYDDQGVGRDRLVLTAARVESMAVALETIAELPDPLFEEVNASTRPNGLEIVQLRVPLGVVGVIYENRPNVTTDVAALCVRSGNAAFLRGSASAQATNELLVDLWQNALVAHELPRDAVSLVHDSDHATAEAFMKLTGVIDCLIPRGGPRLIAAMRDHATVPYVLDGDGNCHVYVDAAADLVMAAAIVRNAKTSRPGVCNAAESLLVHADVAAEFLPMLLTTMPDVEWRADERARALLPGATAATEDDFATEFLDLVMAVAVMDSLDDAVAHVERYGSGHSEAIVTQDDATASAWVRRVDAAAVVVNASTRFVDGSELGLGGEVGISTQKLHARGPMGLKELTCLKWVIKGKGQIR